MKKHLSTIATVLALVIAIISQFRITGLQSEIKQLENRLNNNISMMRSDHSSALSHMQQLMENIDVRSVSLIEELDGKEVARTEIPLTSTESNRGNHAAPEPIPETGLQVNGSEIFCHEINRNFDIPFGSTLELVAEVMDGNGLRYHTVLEHWSINEKGENVDDDMLGLRDLFETILDAEGNILYEADEDDYR